LTGSHVLAGKFSASTICNWALAAAPGASVISLTGVAELREAARPIWVCDADTSETPG